MNLDWNVNYQFSFNKFYPINLKLVFEIPVGGERVVYMSQKLTPDSGQFVVLLDTQKFIHMWRVSKSDERLPDLHLGNESIWRADYKFHYAEDGFRHGKINPVPVASEIGCSGRYPNCQVGFGDNVTRTIWLLANQAEYFPVATYTQQDAENFQWNAGRDNCTVYSCSGLYDAWFLENEHLLPKAPSDFIPEKY